MLPNCPQTDILINKEAKYQFPNPLTNTVNLKNLIIANLLPRVTN